MFYKFLFPATINDVATNQNNKIQRDKYLKNQ